MGVGIQSERHLALRPVPKLASLRLQIRPTSQLLTNWHLPWRCNAQQKLSESYDSVDVSVDEPPHHTTELSERPGGSPARLISDSIIAANCIIYVLQLSLPGLTMEGVQDNDLVMQGEVWRLITAAFLHGSPSHLVLNMISLHALGPIAEWTCGRERFLAIYLGAAICGNIASFLGEPVPSLGASGAIFGLAGALVVYFWRNHKLFGSRFDGLLFRLIAIISLNLVTGHFMPQIDESGHVGGLIGGASLAFLLGPRYELCLVKGRSGVWLVDDAPFQTLATPPRQVLK